MEARQILDNIIQAQEVVHSLSSKRKAGMIMQLDMAKAYDKVNWTYMKRVLIAFGFDHNWFRGKQKGSANYSAEWLNGSGSFVHGFRHR